MFDCCVVSKDLEADDFVLGKAASRLRQQSSPSNNNSNNDSGAENDPRLTDSKPVVAPKYNRNRRAGVSAEAVTRERIENWEAKVFPKSEKDKIEIKKVVQNNLGVLFGHLNSESIDVVVDALEYSLIPTGTDIIRQGDDGDYFYVVKSGSFDIFVQRGSEAPAKVATRGAGSYFGELAMLYNAPRAATVRSTSSSEVWKLDRNSFQMLLVSDNNTRNKKYEDLLSNVELFDSLNKYEKGQVSDLLSEQTFSDGDCIIKQGTEGHVFYVLESGRAVAKLKGEKSGDEEITVKEYDQGCYFGEIALLEANPIRKASIYASGSRVVVLKLDREDFDRVLGPIKDKMRQRAGNYPTYSQL